MSLIMTHLCTLRDDYFCTVVSVVTSNSFIPSSSHTVYQEREQCTTPVCSTEKSKCCILDRCLCCKYFFSVIIFYNQATGILTLSNKIQDAFSVDLGDGKDY